MNKIVNIKSHNFFLILLLLITVAAFALVRPFLTAIIMAFIFAMLSKPIYRYFYNKLGKRSGLANTATIITLSLAIIIPALIMASLATVQLNQLRLEFTDIVAQNEVTVDLITENINKIASRVPGVDTVTNKDVTDFINSSFTSLSRGFFDKVLSIGATSIEFLIQFFVFLFVLVTILPNMDKIRAFFTDLSPLNDELDSMYIEKASTMVSTMIKGTLIIALVQTVMSVISLWMAGVDYLLLLSIVLFIAAIIPFVGTIAVVVPIGILMIIAGEVEWGLFLVISNLVIVNSVDNFLRPYIVSGKTSLNSALILVSILGGIRLFGPFGFIYGPVVMVLAVTTLEVYKKYYRS